MLYEENIHVPWVVWNAGRGPERVAEPAPLRNLPRLLRDLGAGEFDPSAVTRPTARARSEWGHAAVQGRSWKLYARPDERVTFVDLAADPDERSPIDVADPSLQRGARVSDQHVTEVERLSERAAGLDGV